MAELETEPPSSVSQSSDLDTLMSGSGTSEVNKASHDITSEDSPLDKNNTLPSPNVSNNFKSNNCVSGSPNPDGSGHSDQPVDKDDDICKQEDIEIEFAEIQENLKNEQMSQQHSSPISSNGSSSISYKAPTEGENDDSSVNNKHSDGRANYKKKRGVRFPDDSSITRCCDPPNPWKNAPAWTTDELITAYKKSCEINGSKPVVRILQQLHSISTPGKRKESFVLKGEKLDQKQVECIEEILRRVQFSLIDLEATHLDDETAVALFDMIEHYESACQLNISFNRNISARGWQACSRLVRRTPTLIFLDIRNCDLNERTIPIFGRALKMGCHLTVLHMEGMSLTTRPLIILVAALKMNDTLQELFLAENKLVPSDGVQLGNLLRYNHRLNLLDLRNNNLQDVGIGHLCDGLVEQKSGHGLRTLVLWNNQISYQAMHALGRAIASSTSLETLNIGHNGITNEGIHQVKDGLLKTNSLLRLGLQGTRISDEGAVALAEYIADSTILLRIDLRDNEIKTGGLMALSHAMRVNNSVTRIDLDKETKKESGMKDYADVQIRLLRDILTFQERNVQLVMEREEAERARLEKLAIEAQAAREKEKVEKESGVSSPLEKIVSNIESFTIIEADSDEISNDNEKEELSSSSSAEKETESIVLPSKTFSEEEEHMPTHQRPSVLFARMGLQPQESLDSPRTPSSDSSQVFQSPQKPSFGTVPRPTLPLPMPQNHLAADAPPAEMLLSPQYYPKQLARKIFSVSRVSEEMSSPQADDLCEYDPLNVSLISLVPATDFPQSSSALVPADSTETSQALTASSSSSSSAVISPTSLFQDLADETVKHIVSSEDQDLPVLPPSNDCLSSTAESESEMKPNDNCDKDMESNNSQASQDVNISAVNDSLLGPDLEKMDIIDQASENFDVTGETVVNIGIDSIKDTSGDCLNIPESSDCPESQVISDKVIECDKEDSDNYDVRDSNSIDETEFLDSVSSVEKNVNVDKMSDTDTNEFSSSTRGESISSALEKSSLKDSLSSSHNHDDEKDSDSTADLKTAPSPEITPTVSSQGVISNVGDETGKVLTGEGHPTPNTGVELDGVHLSLEEEPWTALEKDGSTMGTSSSRASGEEKQPDFFTTLSMNGLTQELASALTPLDGPAPDCDEDSGPDEFEQELDDLIKETRESSPLN